MTAARSYADVLAMSDDDLIATHDQVAQHTAVGLSFYRDELNRRAHERATEAALEEARAARKLAVVNMWVAIVAVVVTVATVIVQVATAG
jgi:hypothetical protein